MEDKTKKITEEVTNRLNNLFGDPQTDPTPVESRPVEVEQQHFLLEELNAITLSIEWEISDEILSRFISEIEFLKKEFKDDKVIYSFLQLQGAIGQYINKNKANAHPESIKLLHSIHVSLEKVATSPTMPESEKIAMLTEKIKQFKDLKKQIASAAHEKTPTTEPPPRHEVSQKPSITEQKPQQAELEPVKKEKPALENETLVQLLEEIRKIIRDEFKLLKDELSSWKRS